MSRRRPSAPLSAFAFLSEPAGELPSAAAMKRDADLRDEALLMMAVEQARQGIGRTGPNPPVGAVVARGGRVLGKGFHRRAGRPHAEVEAFNDAGPNKSRGATIYVTLEPCNHQGRTGPCTERILDEGVARVVVGVTDPHPRVNGKGIRRLRRAGVEVEVRKKGPAAQACREIIAPFASVHTRGRPWVVVKVAATLDGKIATHTGHATWVTGPASRRLVHQLRDRCDAILVGSGTVAIDDPSLTVREPVGRKRLNPRRVIVDSAIKAPANAKVFDTHPGDRAPPLVLCTEQVDSARQAALLDRGVKLERFEGDRVPLRAALERLAARDVLSVLVEPGGRLLAALVEEGLVDEVWWMSAPSLLGADGKSAFGRTGAETMDAAFDLVPARAPKAVGPDTLLIAGPPVPRA